MTPTETPRARVLVFDLPTRVFHAALALSFVGAWLTAESERWRDVHVTLGYTVLGLVLFRLAWGLVGTRHARFATWTLSPSRAIAYLRSLARGRPEHHAGHNPAGSLAIVAMLALALVVTTAGIATFLDVGGKAVEALHEGAANAMLALVGVHLAGVLVGSLAHRENLPLAMLTGRKRAGPAEGIGSARAIVAVALAGAVLAIWLGTVPLPGLGDTPGLTGITSAAAARGHHRDHDDDD